MVLPISNNSSISGISFSPNKDDNVTQKAVNTSLNSYETEDTAIISAQAKLLNELENYQAGQSDEINLAITGITSKNQVDAMVNVINTKNSMMKKVLEIGD